jgi:hypothetical protein
MGKRSTITGYWRQRNRQSDSSTSRITPAVVPSILQLDVIPADFGLAGGILSGKWLPKGALVYRVDLGAVGLVGATTPAISIGLEFSVNRAPDDDALVVSGALPLSTIDPPDATAGAWHGVEIDEDVEVTYSDASVTQATAGTIDLIAIHYFAYGDDGKVND